MDGALFQLGLPPGPMPPVNPGSLIRRRLAYGGSLIGGIAETQEMLDFCAEHGVVSDVEVVRADQLNEAYDRMVAGDVKYRFVLDASDPGVTGEGGCMSTLFTKIINGEIPGRFVWREDDVVAFLTIGPLADGHTLVVPRQEVDRWTDAPPELLGRADGGGRRRSAPAQVEAFGAARAGLTMAGFEVDHLHLHVWPVQFDGGLRLRVARTSTRTRPGWTRMRTSCARGCGTPAMRRTYPRPSVGEG